MGTAKFSLLLPIRVSQSLSSKPSFAGMAPGGSHVAGPLLLSVVLQFEHEILGAQAVLQGQGGR